MAENMMNKYLKKRMEWEGRFEDLMIDMSNEADEKGIKALPPSHFNTILKEFRTLLIMIDDTKLTSEAYSCIPGVM